MKIGFIGLGNVGGKLAESLLRNKFDLNNIDFRAKGFPAELEDDELEEKGYEI